jgi:hypothetical protein
MTPPPREGANQPKALAILLTALIVTIALEIALYPWVASWIYGLITGQGWDGTALRFFQTFYVLPFGLAFAVVLIAFVLLTTRYRPTASIKAAIIAWVVHLVALGLSVAYYARGVTHT